jgi:hypothetical protein
MWNNFLNNITTTSKETCIPVLLHKEKTKPPMDKSPQPKNVISHAKVKALFTCFRYQATWNFPAGHTVKNSF